MPEKNKEKPSRQKGRPQGTYSQAHRLVKILEMLQTREYLTVSLLQDTFGISRRTVHRDLATLQENYAISESGRLSSGEKTWRMQQGDRSDFIKLSVMEMASLYMGKNLFNFMQGTQLKNSIDSLFSKVAHRLNSTHYSYGQRLDTKFYSTPGAPKDYSEFDDQLNELITGLLEENCVSVRISSKRKDKFEDVLRPLTLVVHNHALYLVAHSEKNHVLRTLPIEKIEKARWLRGRGFEYPTDYRPELHLSSAFGITTGKKVSVTLRPNSEILDYFRRRRWHSSQKIEQSGKDATLVRLKVPITAEFFSWVLSFGDRLEVLEPESLRNQMAQMADGLFRLYHPVRTIN